MIPFGEWLPDAPDYNNQGMTAADGIIPKSDRTYGPLGQLSNAVSAQIGGDAAERVCGGPRDQVSEQIGHADTK